MPSELLAACAELSTGEVSRSRPEHRGVIYTGVTKVVVMLYESLSELMVLGKYIQLVIVVGVTVGVRV